MSSVGGQGSGQRVGGDKNGHFAEGNVELGRSLLRALANTGISVLYQDADLHVVWAQNVPASWSAADLNGKRDHEFLPSSEARRAAAAKQAVFATGQAETLEIKVPSQDGPRWFNVWIDADRDGNGEPRGIITTAVDITEQKRREQTLRTLLREVSHRSKNLLAIIQSVATQTGRYSGTIDGFLTRFRGRLQSLASSQDLVTSSNWRGADLHELAVGQIGRYCTDPGRAIRLTGENPFLNPNAALHIGLALHELAVNSVSYGALSKPEGTITLSAGLLASPISDSGSLALTWTELMPAGGALENKKFGSIALERVVPASLNGRATLGERNGNLEYQLVIPVGSFEID